MCPTSRRVADPALRTIRLPPSRPGRARSTDSLIRRRRPGERPGAVGPPAPDCASRTFSCRSSPSSWLSSPARASASSSQKRGSLGYIALLNVSDQPREMALARIASRAGAMFIAPHTVVYGSVQARHVGED